MITIDTLYEILDGPLSQVLPALHIAATSNHVDVSELASEWLAEIDGMSEWQFMDWKERE